MMSLLGGVKFEFLLVLLDPSSAASIIKGSTILMILGARVNSRGKEQDPSTIGLNQTSFIIGLR